MSENTCIFCKIVNKEIPAHIVYEDDMFIAFLDIHPQSAGHVQVVPKKHYRWVWDVPMIGSYYEVVQKIARAQQKAFQNEWIISKVVGDEVPHAHVWIFPQSTQEDKNAFAANAEKIIENLP